MRWREIPEDARRYIIYHTMISPFLATWYMLPVYMFKLGYSVLDAGLIFTIVNLASIPLTYVVGKTFDRIPMRRGLVLIDILDGIENVLYGMSAFFGKFFLVVGMLFGKIAIVFYPIYQAVEKIIYPKERIEEILSWHMRLPLLFESIGTFVFGYVFGVVFTKVEHYAMGFIIAGSFSVASVFYLMKFIPSIGVEMRKDEFKFRFDREFGYIILLEVLDTLSTELAPNLVLLYYLIEVLKMDFFEAMVIVSIAHLSTLPATYISERVNPIKRFDMIAVYFASKIAWAVLMLTSNFFTILIANVVLEFSDTLSFPFYRSWIFEKVPKDRAGEVFSAVSSLRKGVRMVSPLLAGYLAMLSPAFPYIVGLVLSSVSFLTVVYFKRTTSK